MAPERPGNAGALPDPGSVADASSTPDIAVEPLALPHTGPTPLYAALDLGTNSCRMLIARAEGHHLDVVDSFSKAVQLGQGLETTGRLSKASMQKTVQAMRICRTKLKHHKVSRMRLVATEACRRATNGRDLVNMVRRETGLRLDIIAPKDEARYAVISCAPLVSRKSEQVLIVDIGGGSTELVWIDLRDVPPKDRRRAIMELHTGFEDHEGGAKVVDWISVPLGVATLRDQFDDVSDDGARFALMSWFFEEGLEEFAPARREQDRAGFQIIGTSGTITTVAASHLGLKRYDRTKVDGLKMTSDEID
ncbi:MAG: Ppx/GppA phosphatase family protein, partial [Shimia sp.]